MNESDLIHPYGIVYVKNLVTSAVKLFHALTIKVIFIGYNSKTFKFYRVCMGGSLQNFAWKMIANK